MNFSEKIKSQKNQEKKVFKLSCDLIEDSALGSGNTNGKKARLLEHHSDQMVSAIDQVTDYYSLHRIKIPHGATEDDSKLEMVLSHTGLTRRKVTLNRKWWVRGEGPLVAYNQNNDIICLVPMKFGGYSYIEPKTGEKIKIKTKNAKNISGEGYCFYKPFPNISMKTKDLVKYITSAFSRFDTIFLFTLTLIATLLSLVLPLGTQLIYNNVIPSGTIKDIYPVAILMISMAISVLVFELFKSLWIQRISDKIQFSTQGALWIRLLNLPTNFFKDYSSGDLMQRTMVLSSVCNTISNSLIPTILTAAFSVVYLAQIAALAPSLTLLSLTLVIVNLGLTSLNTYLNIKLNEKANKYYPKLSGLVLQLFAGVSKIKIAGAEVRAFSKWADLYSKIAQIKFNPNFFIKASSAITSLVGSAGTMFIYYTVAVNQVSTANYVAFNTAYGNFSGAITAIIGIAVTVASLKPSLDLIAPILKAVPETDENKERVDEIKGKIEVNNLRFKYTSDGPFIVNGLNLSIKPGEYLGIVGSTGCGKSTLLRLLLGFENPTSGGVFYDDQNLKNLDLHSVRKHIGIVMQNGSLFQDSIFANITITKPNATMDEAWAAAEKAGCADDIKAMPMGMHTMISEEGGGLSGGQQQRIKIARALISNPKLLMFDEATSALDNITQATVVETLSKMDITRIVIAHRLSTIKKCDRIVYLNKGQVVEQGTYDELMNLNGLFAEMAKRQLA